MLYLLLLGLKHILEDDAALPPHSVRWLADDYLLPEMASSDADEHRAGGVVSGGDGMGSAAEPSEEQQSEQWENTGSRGQALERHISPTHYT